MAEQGLREGRLRMLEVTSYFRNLLANLYSFIQRKNAQRRVKTLHQHLDINSKVARPDSDIPISLTDLSHFLKAIVHTGFVFMLVVEILTDDGVGLNALESLSLHIVLLLALFVKARVELGSFWVELTERLHSQQQSSLVHQVHIEYVGVLEMESHEKWVSLGEGEIEHINTGTEVVGRFIGEIVGQQDGMEGVSSCWFLHVFLIVVELGQHRVDFPSDGAAKQQLHLQ